MHEEVIRKSPGSIAAAPRERTSLGTEPTASRFHVPAANWHRLAWGEKFGPLLRLLKAARATPHCHSDVAVKANDAALQRFRKDQGLTEWVQQVKSSLGNEPVT